MYIEVYVLYMSMFLYTKAKAKQQDQKKKKQKKIFSNEPTQKPISNDTMYTTLTL